MIPCSGGTSIRKQVSPTQSGRGCPTPSSFGAYRTGGGGGSWGVCSKVERKDKYLGPEYHERFGIHVSIEVV